MGWEIASMTLGKEWTRQQEQFNTDFILIGDVKDNQRIRPSQHGFVKDRSCLTNLIFFYDQMTRLVGEGKAVDVIYLDFNEAFDTVPHSILLEKLAALTVWMGVLFNG